MNTGHWWQHLSVNLFDVIVLAMLAFGFWRGRKRGMSREALPTAFWLVVVIAAGLDYQLLGDVVAGTGYIKKAFGVSVNERTVAYVSSYLLIAFVIFIIYSQLAKVFREKVAGSNAFGSGEYYLGIIAGMIRYLCILMFFLAFLHAPYYTEAEIAAQKAYDNRWYGGGLKDYSGQFIPSLADVQTGVFRNSISGQLIDNDLGALLIQSGPKMKNHDGIHY